LSLLLSVQYSASIRGVPGRNRPPPRPVWSC